MRHALLAVLLAAAAHAETPAEKQAAAAAAAPVTGVPEQAKTGADAAFREGAPSDETIVRGEDGKPKKVRLTKPDLTAKPVKPDVPPPASAEAKPFPHPALLMGASAVLGGVQGWFSYGLFGAATGAGLGLAAAWLFTKGDKGGSFGLSLGAIIGGFLGGPIGGLIGAAIGFGVGHVLGPKIGL